MMTWLFFKTWASKSWSWLKHNWKIPLLLAWSVMVFIFSRRNSEALQQVIELNKESHKQEIEAINRAHKDEIIKLRNLQLKYKDAISKLQKEFDKQNEELSEKHIEDVKEIVIKSKGNPEEIIRKIEDDFGIKFKE